MISLISKLFLQVFILLIHYTFTPLCMQEHGKISVAIVSFIYEVQVLYLNGFFTLYLHTVNKKISEESGLYAMKNMKNNFWSVH